MTEDEYNALAAARKYVWGRMIDLKIKSWNAKNDEHKKSFEHGIEAVREDLAKIDAVLDAEDGLCTKS